MKTIKKYIVVIMLLLFGKDLLLPEYAYSYVHADDLSKRQLVSNQSVNTGVARLDVTNIKVDTSRLMMKICDSLSENIWMRNLLKSKEKKSLNIEYEYDHIDSGNNSGFPMGFGLNAEVAILPNALEIRRREESKT